MSQTTGKLYIETETEEFVAELVSGVSYTRTKGVKHNVVNQNDHEFVFVEINTTEEICTRPLNSVVDKGQVYIKIDKIFGKKTSLKTDGNK